MVKFSNKKEFFDMVETCRKFSETFYNGRDFFGISKFLCTGGTIDSKSCTQLLVERLFDTCEKASFELTVFDEKHQIFLLEDTEQYFPKFYVRILSRDVVKIRYKSIELGRREKKYLCGKNYDELVDKFISQLL